MTLKELIEQATPLPLEIGEDGDVFAGSVCVAKICGAPDGIVEGKANAALFVHAVNMLPKLVEALEWMDEDHDRSPDDKGFDEWFEKLKQQARAVLAEASNPEVPK